MITKLETASPPPVVDEFFGKIKSGEFELPDLLQAMTPREIDPQNLEDSEGTYQKILTKIDTQLNRLPQFLSQLARSYIIEFKENPQGLTFHQARKFLQALPQVCKSIKERRKKRNAKKLAVAFDDLGGYLLNYFPLYKTLTAGAYELAPEDKRRSLASEFTPPDPEDQSGDIWQFNDLIKQVGSPEFSFKNFLRNLQPREDDRDEQTISTLRQEILDNAVYLPSFWKKYVLSLVELVINQPDGLLYHDAYKLFRSLPTLRTAENDYLNITDIKAVQAAARIYYSYLRLGSLLFTNFRQYEFLLKRLPFDYLKKISPELVEKLKGEFSPQDPKDPDSELFLMDKYLEQISREEFNLPAFFNGLNLNKELHTDIIRFLPEINKTLSQLPAFWYKYWSLLFNQTLNQRNAPTYHLIYQSVLTMEAMTQNSNEFLRVTPEQVALVKSLYFRLGFSLFREFRFYHVLASLPTDMPLAVAKPLLLAEFSPPDPDKPDSEAWLINDLYNQITTSRLNLKTILSSLQPRNYEEYQEEINPAVADVYRILASLPSAYKYYGRFLFDQLLDNPTGPKLYSLYKYFRNLSLYSDRDEIKSLPARLTTLGYSLFRNSRGFNVLASNAFNLPEFAAPDIDDQNLVNKILSLQKEIAAGTFDPDAFLKNMNTADPQSYEEEIKPIIASVYEVTKRFNPTLKDFLETYIRQFLENPAADYFRGIKVLLKSLYSFSQAESPLFKFKPQSVDDLLVLFDDLGWYIFEDYDLYNFASEVLEKPVPSDPDFVYDVSKNRVRFTPFTCKTNYFDTETTEPVEATFTVGDNTENDYTHVRFNPDINEFSLSCMGSSTIGLHLNPQTGYFEVLNTTEAVINEGETYAVYTNVFPRDIPRDIFSSNLPLKMKVALLKWVWQHTDTDLPFVIFAISRPPPDITFS